MREEVEGDLGAGETNMDIIIKMKVAKVMEMKNRRIEQLAQQQVCHALACVCFELLLALYIHRTDKILSLLKRLESKK